MRLPLLALVLVTVDGAELTAQRAPNDGIQPQAVAAPDGSVHLIYYTGDAKAGDIFYVHRDIGSPVFSEPLRVDSVSGSAVAMGSVRGAHLAVGRDGWVHVAWNGSQQATPKGPADSTPMLYARKAASADAFETQRNVLTWASGLDGGGTVTADDTGHVHVAWHANAGATSDDKRGVFLASSSNDGKTFAKEVAAVTDKTGACACCGMGAGSDGNGGVALLYRAAMANVQRDMVLAYASKAGAPFRITDLEPWKIGACPMSTTSIAKAKDGLLIAWQGEQGIRWARIIGGKAGTPTVVPEGKGAKHPAIAEASDGTVAVMWTEGTGWNQGGSLHWQLYDSAGTPMGAAGKQAGVPVWSIPTVVADGPDHFSAWF